MKQFVAVLDNIRSLYNVGSIFRTSDAVGVSKLYLCGFTPTPEHRRFDLIQEKDALNVAPDKRGRLPTIGKTALSGLHTVAWEHKASTRNAVLELRELGYRIVALEITASSKSVFDFTPPTDTPIALIVGHERDGVSPDVLELADEIIHIPMHGKGISLNVAVSYGIASYLITT